MALITETRMVIQRVRSPTDESNYVDVAQFTQLILERGTGPTFMREKIRLEIFQLGDPDDLSNEFTVTSRDDVVAAAAAFAASHPD